MKNPPGSDADLAHAVCAGCGCLCDDVAVRFRGGRAVEVERACTTGAEWIRALGPVEPRALVRGKPAGIDEALETASGLIAASAAPAVVGLHGLTIEALREAVSLADAIGAPLLPCPAIPEALLRSGVQAPECTATLGEVRNTADLVVFWRADPERTHPRHLERYSFEPPLLSGAKRILVVADVGVDNLTARQAAENIPLHGDTRPLERDLTLVRGLRLLLQRGDEPSPGTGEERAMDSLRRRIEASRHAHIFLGARALESPALWNAFHLLAAKLREKHRITVSPMPAPGNARGVLEVLTWTTGHSAPLVAAERVLELGATDLVLALALDADTLNPAAREALDHTPRIALGRREDSLATVWIQAPELDPRLAATVARSDGILLTLNGRVTPRPGLADPVVETLARLRAASARNPVDRAQKGPVRIHSQ